MSVRYKGIDIRQLEEPSEDPPRAQVQPSSSKTATAALVSRFEGGSSLSQPTQVDLAATHGLGKVALKPSGLRRDLMLAVPGWAGCRGVAASSSGMVLTGWGYGRQLAVIGITSTDPAVVLDRASHQALVLDYDLDDTGEMVVGGCIDGVIAVWKGHRGVAELIDQQDDSRICTVSWGRHTSSGALVASQSGVVKLWDVGHQVVAKRFILGDQTEVYQTDWSGAGTLVAAASSDRGVKVIDLRMQDCVAMIDAPHSSAKPTKVMWLDDEGDQAPYYMGTAGIDKSKERSLKLWDIRVPKSPVCSEVIDREVYGATLLDYDRASRIIVVSSKKSQSAVFMEFSSSSSFASATAFLPLKFEYSHSALCLRTLGDSKNPSLIRVRGDNAIEASSVRLRTGTTLTTSFKSNASSSRPRGNADLFERSSMLNIAAQPILDAIKLADKFGLKDVEFAKQLVLKIQEALQFELPNPRLAELEADVERLKADLKTAQRNLRVTDSQRTKALKLLSQQQGSKRLSKTTTQPTTTTPKKQSFRSRLGMSRPMRRRTTALSVCKVEDFAEDLSHLKLPFSLSFQQLHTLIYMRLAWEHL